MRGKTSNTGLLMRPSQGVASDRPERDLGTRGGVVAAGRRPVR